MSCPLCDHQQSAPSWLGSTFYRDQEFAYLECQGCRSLYCSPMPDDETLAHMYGTDYATAVAGEPGAEDEDSKDPQRVVEWLKKEKPGTFVDYGCGGGQLLVEAARLDWRSIGIEFDKEVAKRVERETGAQVVTVEELDSLGHAFADVLHLGDVIEHMTDLERQMPEILKLIKPGGLLLAQGPLEANANLFITGLRLARNLRKAGRTEIAPYHVLLATRRGQRYFFERFGLTELEFYMSEISWPAPSRCSLSDLKRPRHAALFLLRRLSVIGSRLRPNAWGNRYFYAGRLKG